MANYKIRQELSFLNRDTGGLDAYVGEFVYLDTSDYNGASYYFEAILQNSHASLTAI
jgi:hypothetical protein